MKEETFENIESDLQIAKQQFAEAKYIIYETGSFNVFLERLSRNQFKDPKISLFNKEAKEKLKEVKQVSKDYSEEIKEISQAIYKESQEIKELEEIEEKLEKEIKELEIKCLKIEEKESEKMEIRDLEEKLANSEKEREDLLAEKKEKDEELNSFENFSLHAAVKKLHEKKEILLEQEKSILKNKNEIEDLYIWYKNGFELLEKLFGYKYEGFKVEEPSTFIFLSLNDKKVQIVLEDSMLKDIKADDYEWVTKLKETAIKMNDPRIFLLEYKKHLNK